MPHLMQAWNRSAWAAPENPWRELLLWTLGIALATGIGVALRAPELRYLGVSLGLGLGVGAMLRRGLWLWPALYSSHAAFVFGLRHELGDALLAAFVETSGAVLAVLLLRRLVPGGRYLLSMGGLMAFLAMAVAAGLVTMAQRWFWLIYMGSIPFSVERLVYWTLAAVLGILTMAPLVLFWPRRLAELPARAWQSASLAVAGCAAWLWGLYWYAPDRGGIWLDALWHLWLPALVWAAWRGEQLGASLTALGCTLVIALASIAGIGPLAGTSTVLTALHWQSFAVSFAASALIMATAAWERREAESRLREHQGLLEQEVSARAGALERALRERQRVEMDLRATAMARQEVRQRLGESELRYRQLIDTLNDGFLMLDAEGRIEFGNQRLATLSGWPLERLAGRPLAVLFGRDGRRLLRQKLAETQEHSVEAFELPLRLQEGGFMPMLISPAALLHDGQLKGWSVLLYDLRARKAEEGARQELLRVHRDALVREVHHRIKNNLQGIVGLLRQHLRRAPQQAPVLENAIAQVNSVAMVYGLQAREKGQGVRLRGLIDSVCEAITTLTGARVVRAHDDKRFDAALSGQEGVPIALVLNELLTNAVKHGLAAAGSQLVSLSLDWHDDDVMVTIRNASRPGSYPPASGMGGTGLSLVRALLPSHGASLGLEAESEGYVVACLRLAAPVVFIEQQSQG
ncbi:MAG: MASE1 domain-containing protein [Gammaproteobacteria bacterium]|nr:MASE1 domain-containing protein [Gammaproteobacteria bacterium]